MTPRFWLLWTLLFVNVSAGIMVLSQVSPTLFGAALVLVGLCYGGGFGTMPSFTADAFGAKNMGGIYGWMLLAWSVAAIPSPLLIAYVRCACGSSGSSVR